MDRRAWWATVHGVANSQMQLSNVHFSHPIHSSQTFKLPTQHNLANLQLFASYLLQLGFLHGLAGKESTCNAGDPGLIPGLGRSPGEGKGYPVQWTSLVAQTVKRLPAMWETQVQSLDWEDLENEMAAHSNILAWKIPWTG